MIRVLHRACLFVVPLLLLTAGAAAAECSWLLWREYSDGGWATPDVYESQFECRSALVENLDRLERHPETTAILRADRTRLWRKPLPNGQYSAMSTTFHCLPDTIDPRPKSR
jgi:hypothetical protein